MKTRLYMGDFLRLNQGDGKFILGWFPSHYEHSKRLKPELLNDLRERDKALLILENEKGDNEFVEVDGFHNGKVWVDAKTQPLRELIEKEMKKSKFFVAG